MSRMPTARPRDLHGFAGALDHPETQLLANGVERDIRAHAARRKISFGTRSENGRAARDAHLGAIETCAEACQPDQDSRRGLMQPPGKSMRQSSQFSGKTPILCSKGIIDAYVENATRC